jgi:ferric-dicitrate binding protein FerR (iron transport regulator)
MKNQTTTDMDMTVLRHLDGSASHAEERMLRQWLEASEANRADYVEIRDLWLSCDAVSYDDETHEALNRLRSRLPNRRPFAEKRRTAFRRHYAAAVALVLLSFGCWFALHLYIVPGKEVEIQNRLITAQGSKGKFVLPDSSVVWLNAESVLTYPETFGKTERKVCLEGEGYFEVAENREKPFVVQAGDLAVEAVGTVFDISRYSFLHRTEVTLLEGSVRVSSPACGKDFYLSPDQMMEITGDGAIHVRETNARLHASWIQNRLVFDNDRLSDIILSLEGWYRMEIECPAAFAEKTRMSFTVSAESIQDILKAMSLVIPVTWSVTDSTVTIRPKQQKSNH